MSSIVNAFAYTGGPYPLGYIGLQNMSIAYSGLGDVFVLLYFGYVAVLMLPFLQYCHHHQRMKNDDYDNYHYDYDSYDHVNQFIMATAIGLLATNILVVNNLRDRLTDRPVGKLTTAVRFGRYFALCEYIMCNIIAYSLIVLRAILIIIRKRQQQQSSSLSAASLSLSSSPWVSPQGWWSSWLFVGTLFLPLLSAPLSIQQTMKIIHKEGTDLNPHVGQTAMVQFVFCILLSVSCWLE